MPRVKWSIEPRRASCAKQCEQNVGLGDYLGVGTREEKLAEADLLRGGRGPLPPEQVAERVISPQNAWLMTDMMMDVIRRGTGRRALALGRNDIAGKTGTTNLAKDTWFNGFTQNLVATVWVGLRSGALARRERGRRARPRCRSGYSSCARRLRGVPEQRRPMPEGLVTLRISPATGMLASGENPDAILETFMADHLPGGSAPGEDDRGPAEAGDAAGGGGEPIF